MNESIFQYLINQAPVVVFMSIVAMAMNKSHRKREEALRKVIDKKDDQLIECHERLFEISKLTNETWMNVMHSVNEVRRLVEQRLPPATTAIKQSPPN